MEKREIRILDRTFAIEWGKIGSQANGAAIAREGDTVVLVTAVASEEVRERTDFFPLTVEYRERFSAVGRFPGGYRKREGAASEHEILCSRLIDRSIRPLFPEGLRNEVQVMATVLAAAPGGDPPILAIVGASAALTLADIPWNGPVAPVRIGIGPEGGVLANPNEDEKASSSCDLLLTFDRNGLVMAEGGAGEIEESRLLEAIEYGSNAVKPLFRGIDELRAIGKEKRTFAVVTVDPAIRQAVEREVADAVRTAVRTPLKHERTTLLRETHLNLLEAIASAFGDRGEEVEAVWSDLVDRVFRRAILDEGLRIDGRGTSEIRPISCEVGWLPRVHGSAVFTRGETQSIAVCTLGTGNDEQEVESLEGVRRERFHLFYRFPPYSVGEVRPLRGPGRREIGHGHLARRALEPVLPPPATFPYTIKIESEITSSNGSSSMATVCGGCLCMMDAGVPIVRPVAGIAMGLVRDGDRVVILSDILGDEDHLGDMDFKVAGTTEGITAVQLDNKIGAVPIHLLKGALEQAREGRLHILGQMAKVLPKPRRELSPNAPRVAMIQIGRNRIRDLIGPGGRVIQDLQADTGTRVDVDDNGVVRVYAQDSASLDLARKRIDFLTGEPEVGRVYRGVVTGVKEFGVFVRLFSGIEGLVHVTELAPGPIREVSQVAREGEEMVVKVLGVDGQGKIQLSRKQAMNIAENEIANA